MVQRTLPPVDVAIVGGGPVGVMMGVVAVHHGLTAAVLERETEIYGLPRAVGMDDEVQRVFHTLGLGRELAARSSPLAGAEFVDVAGERLIGIDLPLDLDYPLGHHPMVLYHQPDLEAMLRDVAVVRGVQLRLGHPVTGVGQDQDGAWIDAEGPDGPVRQPARWVVAADGASSPTRKSLGIAFHDAGFDQEWLVVDAVLHDPTKDHGLPRLAQQICDPARPTTFIPGHGPYRRWELQLQDGEDREEMVRPDRVWELVGRWLSPDQAELSRAVVYRFHATVADRMRDGRVFLAGDAAHQMPPFQGQGLASGIRDTVNLGWKLAAVAAGRADDRLLDTYDAERRPHAYGMVAHAVDTGRTIDRLAGRVEPDEDVALDAAYGGERPFPHLETGVRSGTDDRIGRQLNQPTFHGQPLDAALGAGWSILLHDRGDLDAATLDRWRQLDAALIELDDGGPATFLAPSGGAVIVRPDRYVAAVADDAAAFCTATDELLSWFATPVAEEAT